jgi:leucine dehydrogenase
MARKNALAGLWWGGGKGIVARLPGDAYRDPGQRAALYSEYAEFVTSLRGCYITAEDAGTGPDDMAVVHGGTRFVTCIPPAIGGSGNPSPATARGVVCAMEGALAHLGLGTLEGKKIAMQGAGNVAGHMIGELLTRGVGGIVASELSAERRAELGQQFAGAPLTLPPPSPATTASWRPRATSSRPTRSAGSSAPRPSRPCAPGSCAAPPTTSCSTRTATPGPWRPSASSTSPTTCATAWASSTAPTSSTATSRGDPAIERHLGREWDNSVFVITRRALELAEREGITTAAAANRLADELAQVPHPVWGDRTRGIIAGLVASRWHLS